jgi:hypothetical protein
MSAFQGGRLAYYPKLAAPQVPVPRTPCCAVYSLYEFDSSHPASSKYFATSRAVTDWQELPLNGDSESQSKESSLEKIVSWINDEQKTGKIPVQLDILITRPNNPG